VGEEFLYKGTYESTRRRIRVMFLIVSWILAYWAFWAVVLYNVL